MPRSRRTRRRRIAVTVDVPFDYRRRIPSIVRFREAPKYLAPRRTLRVGLRSPRRTVRRRVVVEVPQKMPVSQKGYLMYRPGRLTIYNRKATENVLRKETHRRRYKETKRRRGRYSTGQTGAVRRDRYGILGAAVSRRRSGTSVDDAAMVARALDWMT